MHNAKYILDSIKPKIIKIHCKYSGIKKFVNLYEYRYKYNYLLDNDTLVNN